MSTPEERLRMLSRGLGFILALLILWILAGLLLLAGLTVWRALGW